MSIETQMAGYHQAARPVVCPHLGAPGVVAGSRRQNAPHQGREGALTEREFQLLQFLLDHPERYFTSAQILSQAWADPALLPEEVRNHVRRLRKKLHRA